MGVLTRERRAASWSADEFIVPVVDVEELDCADSGRLGVNSGGRPVLDAEGVLRMLLLRLRDITERNASSSQYLNTYHFLYIQSIS